MKLQGILGKGTGKLGNAVFAVSGGEQIMREYNPNVSNPNTEAQVAQRAKLKLLSQVAAALSSAIAIPKEGLVSSRNLFIKINFELTSFEEGVADVAMDSIQLTKSSLEFPVIRASAGEGNVTVSVDGQAPGYISRVAYVVCKVDEHQKISVMTSSVVSEAGAGRTFETTIQVASASKLVIYAYGMVDKSSAATAKYESYKVDNSLELANLITSRALGVGDFAFTKTNATIIG